MVIETIDAYKADVECTNEERVSRAKEAALCRASFSHFLKYARIIEAPTRDKPGGIIGFQLWSHIKDMLIDLRSEKLLVWLKSRQIGASWTIALWCLWNALSHYGDISILYSKGEVEAVELLAKCRRIYKQLPSFLQLRANPDSSTEIGFPTMSSSIKALAATETAGIGYTASRVICDEWEEHPYAAQNFLSAKPTIDAGGQFIGVFTVNKLKATTLAKTVYIEARDGKNNFKARFFPYHVRPNRDSEWYEFTKRGIPEAELSGLTPDLFMEQCYPATEEEALRTTQTVSAFNLKVIDEMMGDTRNPVEVKEDGIDSQIIHIYKPFYLGNFYIASSDTGHGVGRDYSVTPVMDVRSGEVVADIFANNISVEEFASHSVKLLKLYKNPLWFPEDNEWGRVVINVAQRLGYKNFGYSDTKKTKIGWHTDEKSRFDLWGGLIPALDNRQIRIYNGNGLKQFYDIIRNVKKEGRIEAISGRHDDYPMAVGICWVKKDEVKTGITLSKPLETLTFGKSELPVVERWMDK